MGMGKGKEAVPQDLEIILPGSSRMRPGATSCSNHTGGLVFLGASLLPSVAPAAAASFRSSAFI